MKIDARTETEQTNARLVADFIDSWMAEDFDLPCEYKRYLHPEAEVRLSEEHPMIKGVDGVIEAMQAFIAQGGAVKSAISEEVIARGPLVLNVRTDVVTIPGQGDMTFHIAANLLVVDGKITEWAEFSF